MDLPTIANLAEAFAVIVAVVFGMVQLRQLHAQRRREAAFALMHSIQSLQMVDDFYSGTLEQSWRKLQRYVEELREAITRPTRWEWFQ